jgi:predicted secreted protein
LNGGLVNSSGPDSKHASDAHDGRMMATTVDHPFIIRLWEDRTRGEQWVPSYDAKGLALLSDEFLRIAGNNAVENGQRTFEFKAMTPGLHQLVFEKRMGWKFTSEDRRLFRINAM